MEDICGGTVINWILQSPNKALDNPSTSSTSNATYLRGPSWRESITTLSLRRCSGKHALKLIQACSSLKTLNFSPQSSVAPFPFDEILRLPTLEYVYIQSRPSVPFSWLISSFRPSNLSPLSPYHIVQTKPKIVSIDTPVELSRTATTSFRTTVSKLLVKILEFDEVVSFIPGVEVNLKITILEPSHQDDQARIEHEDDEQAKTTLAGLGADIKVLKLEEP
ncbi:hypothetical protein ONZ45_g4527 [Pleurotus djamor]|nr:hypothetical protein ONZ45_g4527 [Pleurotus djamor]